MEDGWVLNMINNDKDYKKWRGIPFRHLGRDITRGCDCIGLLLHFYKDILGVDLFYLDRVYNKKWYRSDKHKLRKFFESNFKEVKEVQAGDILLFKIAKSETHIGICINKERFLFTNYGTGSVILTLNDKWRNRVSKIYRKED